MKKGRKLALWGACLQLGQVFGLLGTYIAGIGASNAIEAEGNGAAEAIASYINLALYTTAVGIIAVLIGIVLLLVALFSHRYRAPWFFWFMAIYSVLMLLAFPIGTVFGIVVLVYIILRRKEFRSDPVVV